MGERIKEGFNKRPVGYGTFASTPPVTGTPASRALSRVIAADDGRPSEGESLASRANPLTTADLDRITDLLRLSKLLERANPLARSNLHEMAHLLARANFLVRAGTNPLASTKLLKEVNRLAGVNPIVKANPLERDNLLEMANLLAKEDPITRANFLAEFSENRIPGFLAAVEELCKLARDGDARMPLYWTGIFGSDVHDRLTSLDAVREHLRMLSPKDGKLFVTDLLNEAKQMVEYDSTFSFIKKTVGYLGLALSVVAIAAGLFSCVALGALTSGIGLAMVGVIMFLCATTSIHKQATNEIYLKQNEDLESHRVTIQGKEVEITWETLKAALKNKAMLREAAKENPQSRRKEYTPRQLNELAAQELRRLGIAPA